MTVNDPSPLYTGLDYELPPPSVRLTNYPTCNYDACENASYRAYKDRLVETGQSRYFKLLQWGLTFVIGVGTALVAYGIDVVVHQLEEHKNDWVVDRINDDNGSMSKPFGLLMGVNMGYVAVAAFLVFLVPAAAGSGIPEVKCYLNGLRLPDILALRTLIAKATGVLMSVSGGLPCGKEGPMIHSGAIIASGVSQGILPWKSSGEHSFWFSEGIQKIFLPFRDDKSKRDFISCGAAAGVSAAFGAPVGGVLFALEEGCSFWDPELTWRLFFCSITCAFSMAFFTNTGTGERSLNAPGMIDFGDFSGSEVVPFSSVEIIWFILIGGAGGLLGALFNFINLEVTKFRSKRDEYFSTMGYGSLTVRGVKFFEALVMSLLVTGAAFFCMAGLDPVCNSAPKFNPETDGSDVTDLLVTVKCPDGQYNSQATLWLNSASESLRFLFHFTGNFDKISLLIAGILYFTLMVVNYGVAVPSGLFVPSLVTGALFGRIAGELIKQIPYHEFQKIDAGTYALIGAASFLAGVCRITFSLTVILIEATRDIAYALPLMFCIMTAKLVGDAFNKGIYDMHIEHRKLSFLEPSINETEVRRTTVSSFMTKKESLVTFNPVESVSRILTALKTRKFCGFPVCRDDHAHYGTQHDGLMTRSRLLVLLKKKAFKDHRKIFVTKTLLASSLVTEDGTAVPDENEQGHYTSGAEQVLSFMHKHRLDRLCGKAHGASSMIGNMVTVSLEGFGEEVSLPYKSVHDVPHDSNFLSWDEFNYPNVNYKALQGSVGLQAIEDGLSEDDYDQLIDLRPYMNPQPFLVPDNFSYNRCYKLFRSVGMRHMLVIDGAHKISGIVTRFDLWRTYHQLEHPPKGWKNDRGVLVKDAEYSEPSETGNDDSHTIRTDEGGSMWDGEGLPSFNPF
eukprot:TRINITY_DN21185_c0_g1_i1.p1 TRINITY_DN21185_c0_g1~~TRINITY_DN21185_c0_g1_i1.p1  ORF type:complete len:902 (+),score=98.88 TRINITY_DN21185_c0_g1_i1:77-2782(+)